MQVLDLGLVDYKNALKIQEDTVEKLRTDRTPSNEALIVCEHPTVITLGRAPGAREDILKEEVPVYEIARGGRATLHLPGQVVIYPILDLEKRNRNLIQLLRDLEGAIIATLADFRITADRIENQTGVWVKESRRGQEAKKIASLGLGSKNWISFHGLALNVTCDLKEFKRLNPCGFSPDVMTSVFEELSPTYIREWEITRENLFAKVKMRLIENLKEQITPQ